MNNLEKMKRLNEIAEEVYAYSRSIEKLNFDLQCSCPADGMGQAGNDMAILGRHVFALLHSDETVRLICELNEDHEGLTALQQKFVEYMYDDYKKTKNFTPEFAYEKDCAVNEAYSKWLSAKKAGDFSMFSDSLARVADFTRKSVELRDDKPTSCYDACLNDFERGTDIKGMDSFFSEIKKEIIPLIQRIQKEGKPIRDDFLSRNCPISTQEEMSRWLLAQEGIKDSAFVLATTEHPFTTNFGPHDVRVATHYYEDNFVSNVFSIMHEGGHALFMQFEPEEFAENHVNNRMTNGMHECVSRFYENIIGRSEAFIHFAYPAIMECSKGVFADVSERELYEAVNIAKPSLIRTEADELTYSLHIVVRYEIEKALINGEITVDMIPELWNRKYKEYLGVDVPNDTEGCLQDVHWTSDFGYFPSYALGNAYGAQILRTMEKEFDVFKAVGEGKLSRVTEWFKEHVFSKASILTPDEWLKDITGETLNVRFYIDYLKEKYLKLYGLDA